MMSSGEKVRKFLKSPFNLRTRNPTPRPAVVHTPADAPDTNVLTNSVSGSLFGAGASISNGIVSPNTLGETAHAAGDQPFNSQPPTVPMPAKNEAFERAVVVALQKHINSLSDDDKVAFQSATDVMKKLGGLQHDRPHVSDKVQKVLQCVKKFLGSVAICIQHSPEISSLVVGGLNCALTLALNYIEFFEKLTDMMERIGGHLTYLSMYAVSGAFQASDELQEALVAAYCDLLDFYVKVRGLFTYKEGSPSYIHDVKQFLRVTWEPFEEHFQSIETRFLHHAKIVVHLANAEQQIHLYKKETQDKQRQEAEENKKLDERRREILAWLSTSDFEEIHHRHFGKRFGGTGQWLLDDSRFIGWRDKAQSGLLWCHGAPGSGKTILASLVIEHLSAYYELSPSTGITFIYCDYTRSYSSLEYIRLAIKQLCQKIQPLPSKLEQIYQKHYNNHSQPGFQELQNIFLIIVQQFRGVFFVLDALDECTLDQRAELCNFFAETVELASGTSGGAIKLFVASRKELDIERAFLRKSFPAIEVEAAKVDSDIQLYVKAQIEQRLHLDNTALKNKILTALTTKAGGMFLWVEFQLKAICEQVSDYGMEEAFKNIPQDLDTTYERILDIINKKPPAQRELARKALLFITYARRPVSIETLALAIAVKDTTQHLDMLRLSISTEKVILNACGNLISVDEDSDIRYVRFVHFSVHEFLSSHRSGSDNLHTLHLGYQMAHREIAQLCMNFLLILYAHIQDYCTTIESSFTKYILHELPHHLLAGNLSSLPRSHEMVNLTLSFFKNAPPMLAPSYDLDSHYLTFLTFSPSVLALIFDLPVVYTYYNVDSQPKQLDQKLLRWIYERVNGEFEWFVLLSDNRLAIHYATGQLDSVAVAQRLYTYEYPINWFHNASQKPLHALHNLPDWIVSLQQYIPDFCKLTALYLVKSGEMARFLLDSGARIDSQVLNGKLRDLLEHLAERGNTEVLQLVFDRGVEQHNGAQSPTLQEERYCSKAKAVLHNAAYHGNIETMRWALEKGVDVNTRSGHFGNVLQAAVSGGSIRAIQLLLDEGVDVNFQGGIYGNALQAAARHGKVEVIQLLLDNGADVDVLGGEYGNALQAAAYTGKVEAMKLLLDRGVDANVLGGFYGNALQAAAASGNINAMELLLDNGADIHAKGGRYQYALQAAALAGKVEAMQLLLYQGADVNARGGEYDNALQAAAYTGNVEAMQLLLERGAESVDVNVRGGFYGNALQAAAVSGNVKAMELLLDNGADAHAQGGYYGNALQAAVHSGEVEAMLLLLDKGADINAQGGYYGSPLGAAYDTGEDMVVQLLLTNGAIDRKAPVVVRTDDLSSLAICVTTCLITCQLSIWYLAATSTTVDLGQIFWALFNYTFCMFPIALFRVVCYMCTTANFWVRSKSRKKRFVHHGA